MDEAGTPRQSRSSQQQNLSRCAATLERGAAGAPQRAVLAQGAPAHGFRGDVSTCERVAEVVRKEFGVVYHPAHVSRLLRALGLSSQKPARRATQRDEQAVRRWKEERWPQLKKGR